MSERAVSDLIFRDLWPKAAEGSRSGEGEGEGEEWEKQLREELDKLRPRRPAPRVVPAAEAAGREPSASAAQQQP
jgi:hypothetical protein